MKGSLGSASPFRFGVFELDLQAGQLRKRGVRLKLQDQPFQILTLLIERSGEVVSREEIQMRVWSTDTFVDVDNAINGAVRKIRDALGDDAETPRFIETVARRGYRFIAPLAREPAVPSAPVQTGSAEIPVPATRTWAQTPAFIAVLCGVSLAAGGGLGYLLSSRSNDPPAMTTLTYSGRDSSPTVSPDGKTVAFASDRDGASRIWLKQLKGGGEVALTSGPDSFPRFSADGATILFSRAFGERHSLFKVASVGGEQRRVIDDALDGDFSPDGRRFAFVRWGQENRRHVSSILISPSDGSAAVEIARIADVRLDFPRWSPDGSMIAAVGAPAAVSGEIFTDVWLVRMEDKRLSPLKGLLPERGISSVAWQDRRTIVYTRGARAEGSGAEIVAHDVKDGTVSRKPWPCCVLTLDTGGLPGVVFDERANRAGLLEFSRDGESSRWVSHANSPDRQPVFSPDGKWVVFSSDRDGHMNLWQISLETGAVSRLTENNAVDFDAAFSPNGAQLIFTSDRSGHFEIYIAARDGSGVRPVTPSFADAENATMTPDGRWIVYASSVPGGSGLWKIHPDGSGATQIMRGLASNPEVSPDGEYVLYLVNPQPDVAEIRVLRVADGAEVPGLIQCRRRRQNGVTLGRARWAPSAGAKTPLAIAFIDQDAAGSTGVSIQDFVPGRDTSATRRPLRRFDPIAPVETLAVSADGTRFIISVADDTSSIRLASRLPKW